LSHLGELRSRYREAIVLLEPAVDALAGVPSATRSLGDLLGCLSFMYFRVGAIERAIEAGDEAPTQLSSAAARHT
jgi:hypothetical protein